MSPDMRTGRVYLAQSTLREAVHVQGFVRMPWYPNRTLL